MFGAWDSSNSCPSLPSRTPDGLGLLERKSSSVFTRRRQRSILLGCGIHLLGTLVPSLLLRSPTLLAASPPPTRFEVGSTNSRGGQTRLHVPCGRRLGNGLGNGKFTKLPNVGFLPTKLPYQAAVCTNPRRPRSRRRPYDRPTTTLLTSSALDKKPSRFITFQDFKFTLTLNNSTKDPHLSKTIYSVKVDQGTTQSGHHLWEAPDRDLMASESHGKNPKREEKRARENRVRVFAFALGLGLGFANVVNRYEWTAVGQKQSTFNY